VRVPLDPLLPGVPGIVCEIQIRSELQDIWARRSHELLYKKHGRFPEEKIEYMKHMSDFLKTVDNFLITIRDEVTTT
jgi:ppGpp synthetase/RelA/SpoT-type nucleotidyltranferase